MELGDGVKLCRGQLGIEPTDGYYELGDSLLKQGKYEEAEQAFFRCCVEIYLDKFTPPENEYIYPCFDFEEIFTLGYRLLTHGKFKEAEQKFIEGANIGPYFEEVYNALKPMFQKRSKPDSVAEPYAKYYAQYCAKYRSNLLGRFGDKSPLGLGRELLNQRDYEGAEREFRKYITSLVQIKEAAEKRNWTLTCSLVLLAYSLDKQGKRSEARPYWVKAERIIPEVFQNTPLIAEYMIIYKRLSEPD
jgi:tetratricopeptide (TPR) repeat protein